MKIYRFGLLVIGLILGGLWVGITHVSLGLGLLSTVAVMVLVIILLPDTVGRRNWKEKP